MSWTPARIGRADFKEEKSVTDVCTFLVPGSCWGTPPGIQGAESRTTRTTCSCFSVVTSAELYTPCAIQVSREIKQKTTRILFLYFTARPEGYCLLKTSATFDPFDCSWRYTPFTNNALSDAIVPYFLYALDLDAFKTMLIIRRPPSCHS